MQSCIYKQLQIGCRARQLSNIWPVAKTASCASVGAVWCVSYLSMSTALATSLGFHSSGLRSFNQAGGGPTCITHFWVGESEYIFQLAPWKVVPLKLGVAVSDAMNGVTRIWAGDEAYQSGRTRLHVNCQRLCMCWASAPCIMGP